MPVARRPQASIGRNECECHAALRRERMRLTGKDSGRQFQIKERLRAIQAKLVDVSRGVGGAG
jgi:hypothetical protein